MLQFYGEDKVSARGALPAHLLGNMWAQDWSNIFDLLVPYPNKPSLDVTENMKNQVIYSSWYLIAVLKILSMPITQPIKSFAYQMKLV